MRSESCSCNASVLWWYAYMKKYHVHFCTLITWIFWVDGTACSKLEVFFHRWWSWVRDQHTSKTESPVWCNASSRCRSTLPYCLGSYTYAPQKPTGRKIGDYTAIIAPTTQQCGDASTSLYYVTTTTYLLGAGFLSSGGPLLPILIQLLWNVRSAASMGPGPKSNNESHCLYSLPHAPNEMKCCTAGNGNT